MARPTDFKIIPASGELSQIERDLRFSPSPVTEPETLSREEVEKYNSDGYVRRLRIFSDEEITRQRQYFDRLLEQVTTAGGDSYSISTAHLKYGRVYDVLTNEKIVACVADLLGENVIGWGSHYFCKMPHDGKAVAWHQDASYWPLTPSKTVTVWLAIDDATRKNACMRYLRKSHLEGHIPYRESNASEGNVLDQTVEDVQRFGEPVDVELAAGEIAIHSDLLLHGSQANNSDRRRCGLTLRYCTADVTAHMDWNQKGVIVRGRDERGHWANPPRPVND